MTVVKIDKIISFSSEDTVYPAQNLLSAEVGKSKKWKCKSPGEKNAIVVFQLDRAVKIDTVDVGNENSAFIEIQVGRSCLPDEFKTLLPAKMIMAMQESKDGTNTNCVKFFKTNDFTKPEADEKWDRVKVICSQPFNKYIQYGLSFITFHIAEDKPSSSCVGGLGKFALKTGEEEDNSSIKIGSLFARRKEFKNDDPESEKKGSLAAAIRSSTDASPNDQTAKKTPASSKKVKAPISSSDPSNSNSAIKNTPGSSKKVSVKAATTSTDPSTNDSAMQNTPVSSNRGNGAKRDKKTSKDEDSPTKKKPRNNSPPARPSTNKGKNLTPASSDKPSVKKKMKGLTKPFNRFMEGVIFTISGFQNPLRSDIRSSALEMGARYKGDWDSSCTHLICAFTNTPKFNQVRGRGKIVKKEWIEDSHSRRIRFPWRRYALDRRDLNAPESEEEIYEEVNDPVPSVSTRRLQTASSDEDEDRSPSLFSSHLKKNAGKTNDVDNNKASVSKVGNSSENDMDVDKISVQSVTMEDPPDSNGCVLGPAAPPRPVVTSSFDISRSDDSTQSDPEWTATVDQDVHPAPYLSDQFTDLSFYISADYDDKEKDKLKRYIIAHCGSVQPVGCSDVEYVIAERPGTVNSLRNEHPDIIGVKSEWIWRCHDENRLLPSSKFEL